MIPQQFHIPIPLDLNSFSSLIQFPFNILAKNK